MTSPQQRPETIDSTKRTESPARNFDAGSAAEPSANTFEPTHRTDPSGDTTDVADSSTRGTESSDRRTGTSTDKSLFAEHEVSHLLSRWADVQAAFVDDPKACVQKADGLVADVVDKLTTGFAEARSRLEAQWGRGEEVSTETLRVTLKRYRDFFERLLAV